MVKQLQVISPLDLNQKLVLLMLMRTQHHGVKIEYKNMFYSGEEGGNPIHGPLY